MGSVPDRMENLPSILRPLILEFLQGVDYTPFTAHNPAVKAAIFKKADAIGLEYPEGSSTRKTLMLGVLYAETCFPNHPVEVQIFVAFYTCFGFLIDDETSRSRDETEQFVERFCKGELQATPALQGWANIIQEAFVHFDPLVANFITSSSLNFLSSNLMEARGDLDKIRHTAGAGQNFTTYIRIKDGVGEAFSYFAFPKALYPDVSQFAEAIPEMERFIDLVNDVLSFYKEELDGETGNYIHSRASHEMKDSITVLIEVINECLEYYNRMATILKGKGKYEKVWRDYMMGYVAFHKRAPRYKLADLGLGEI